jgi:hypothetical protein
MTDDQKEVEVILSKKEYMDLERCAKEDHMSIGDVIGVAWEEWLNEWESTDEHARQLLLERARSQCSPEEPVCLHIRWQETA